MKLLELARAKWKVLVVCDEEWECQVLDSLVEFEENGEPCATRMLATLFDYVPISGPPKHNDQKCKKIKGHEGIFELKEGTKRGLELRLLFFYDAGRAIVATELFSKAERTPEAPLKRAVKLIERYKREKEAGNLQFKSFKEWSNE